VGVFVGVWLYDEVTELLFLYRHKKCVQKLVEAGADIRIHDNEGLTAVSPD